MIWGACVVDEVQDIDAAGTASRSIGEKEKQEILAVIRKKNKSTIKKPTSNPTWRKKIQGGHRIKLALDP